MPKSKNKSNVYKNTRGLGRVTKKKNTDNCGQSLRTNFKKSSKIEQDKKL